MRASEATDADVRTLVHVAGPVEAEDGAWVQRCLRCDELLIAAWTPIAPPPTLVLGAIVATDAFDGAAGELYLVGGRRLRRGERRCRAIPAELL